MPDTLVDTDLLIPLVFVGDTLDVALFDNKADAVTVADIEDVKVALGELDTELVRPADLEYECTADGDCVTNDEREDEGDPV